MFDEVSSSRDAASQDFRKRGMLSEVQQSWQELALNTLLVENDGLCVRRAGDRLVVGPDNEVAPLVSSHSHLTLNLVVVGVTFLLADLSTNFLAAELLVLLARCSN